MHNLGGFGMIRRHAAGVAAEPYKGKPCWPFHFSLTDADWVDVHATVTCSDGIRIDLPVEIYEPQPQQWVAPVCLPHWWKTLLHALLHTRVHARRQWPAGSRKCMLVSPSTSPRLCSFSLPPRRILNFANPCMCTAFINIHLLV